MLFEIEKKYLIEENNKDFATKEFYNIFDSIDSLKQYVKEKGWWILQAYLPQRFLTQEKINFLFGKQGIEAKINFNPQEARIRYYKRKHTFTLKSKGTLEKEELEKEITLELFQKLYDNYTEGRRVARTRAEFPYKDQIIKFNVYDDHPLVIAEIEFESKSLADKFPALGKDITEDKRYENRNLAK